MNRRRLLVTAVVLAGVAGSPPAAAQETDTGGIPLITPLWRALSDPSRAGWVRPLSSALVPGTGQLLGRRERGALYLIAEAFFVVRFIGFQNEGRRERSRYRDLALDVARAAFDPVLRDTTFEYFEQMGRFVESGPYDVDPGPDIVPPTDPATYNGRIWELARQTFFIDSATPPLPGDPDYERALEFYQRRAIGPNFRWSWRNAGLEQDLFRQAIRESDRAFRLASQQLGLLLANHVLSAVDAFVAHRLAGDSHDLAVHTELWAPPEAGVRDLGITLSVRIGF